MDTALRWTPSFRSLAPERHFRNSLVIRISGFDIRVFPSPRPFRDQRRIDLLRQCNPEPLDTIALLHPRLQQLLAGLVRERVRAEDRAADEAQRPLRFRL